MLTVAAFKAKSGQIFMITIKKRTFDNFFYNVSHTYILTTVVQAITIK